MTSASVSRVISWTSYNEWGEITHNAVIKCGQRELDLVKNYTGHEYDAVLDMYYAKARMYDADNRRFAAVDPIKGSVVNPLTLVQYLYVIDNPLKYVDPLGQVAVDIEVYANAMGATTNIFTKDRKKHIDITYAGISQTYIFNSGKIEDTTLNDTFGWNHSWIPNGQVYAVYTGVHSVAAGNYHSSVLIFSIPGSAIFDIDEFGNYINPYAKEFGCYDGQGVKYVTLGAGDKSGKLASDLNRTKDLQLGRKVEMINMGISDVNTINSLIEQTLYFRDNATDINYDLWPDPNKTTKGYGKGYNSNSFVAGLLKASEITPKTPTSNVPGFDKPVPTNHYRDEK